MYDVIVVGAGPAGSQSALQLSKAGHSVLLLDAEQQIGDKLCTGIVSAECAARYGVTPDLILHRGRDMVLVPPSSTPIKITKRSTQAFVIDRVQFVRSIADDAKAHGTTIRFGHRVIDLRADDRGVSVTTKREGEIDRYEGRALVVATGFGGKLADKVGLDVPRHVAYAAQVEISDCDLTELHVFVRKALPRGTFGWIAPIVGGKAHFGILGRDRPLATFESFASQIKRDGYYSGDVGQPKTWGVPLRASRKSYSDRCVLVGDAAGQIKPTSGGGIFFSLIGADLASEVLSDALMQDDLSERQLAPYEHRWKAAIGKEQRLGYIARLFFESMNDSEVESILSAAVSCGFFDAELDFDRHSVMISRLLRSGAFLSLLKSIPRIALKSTAAARF